MTLNTVSMAQSVIDSKKLGILSTLSQFFSPAEIQEQNTSISSLITASDADAAAILLAF
jgi:hypothetical protein